MNQPSAVVTPIAKNTDMPLTDIVASLAKINAEQVALKEALVAAKAAAKDSVVQGVRDLIASNGFTEDEILPLLMPKAKGAKRGRKPKAEGAPTADASYPTYILKSDPSKTYIRGVLPAWMKEAMTAAGLDPKQGADRAKFKADYMTASIVTAGPTEPQAA